MTGRTTAADLIRRRACTAACLLSYKAAAKHCGCRCRGEHHGALALAELPARRTTNERNT